MLIVYCFECQNVTFLKGNKNKHYTGRWCRLLRGLLDNQLTKLPSLTWSCQDKFYNIGPVSF